MISQVLVFLKQRLNDDLKAKSGWMPDEPSVGEDKVVFVDSEQMDPIIFKLGAVSLLLINVEEDNLSRAPDPYSRIAPDGTRQSVKPDIRLNLYVLFVARFKQYDISLSYLSFVIQFFQNHRVINSHDAPDLSERIEQLSIELITLPFAEQSEIWNALRTSYHPSVLYKVKTVVFSDEDIVPTPVISAETSSVTKIPDHEA